MNRRRRSHDGHEREEHDAKAEREQRDAPVVRAPCLPPHGGPRNSGAAARYSALTGTSRGTTPPRISGTSGSRTADRTATWICVPGSWHDEESQRTCIAAAPRAWNTDPRSEEHTSELQSRGHLVC